MERWVFLSLLYYQHDLSEIQGNFPDNPAIVLYGETIFPLGCSDASVFLTSFEHFKNILIDSDDVHMQLRISAPVFARMGRDSLSLLSSSERNVRRERFGLRNHY
jgi:hypothetical protein